MTVELTFDLSRQSTTFGVLNYGRLRHSTAKSRHFVVIRCRSRLLSRRAPSTTRPPVLLLLSRMESSRVRGKRKAEGSALRHLPPRTVVRERADRSQVTELLTNVRSGRRRIASHKRCGLLVARFARSAWAWIQHYIRRTESRSWRYCTKLPDPPRFLPFLTARPRAERNWE